MGISLLDPPTHVECYRNSIKIDLIKKCLSSSSDLERIESSMVGGGKEMKK